MGNKLIPLKQAVNESLSEEPAVMIPAIAARRINVELTLLREFYLAWVDLHSTARDALHRKQLEAKGQKLVECGRAVTAYRKSYPENVDG